MFPYAYKLINKFQSEEGIEVILLCDFRPATIQDRTKSNVLLQLGRDIVNGVCYQRYENVLCNRKVVQLGPNVNVCAAEKVWKRNYN